MSSSNTEKRVTQMPEQPQPELRLAALTNLCKASADTLRLLVLRVLRKDSFGVSELCTIFANHTQLLGPDPFIYLIIFNTF